MDKYSQYILNSLSEGVIVLDKEFKIISINRAAGKLLNKKKEDIVGMVCKNFCLSEQCELMCPISEILITGKNIYDLETVYQKSGGETLPVKINAAVLQDENNEPIGGVISFQEKKDIINYKNILENDSHYYGIVGKSEQMIELFNTIEEIKETDTSVLISGETGVGKELVANAIVETSRRKNKPFVKINCAVLPETLLASELFGHVRGAFTDATRDRIGRFELADTGTIFLDEIGEMPYNMQTQLLRIIQEGTFERVGESKTQKVDVRIIAATNKNLEEEIVKKKFREDLYYRLNVIPLKVPPLRERETDILLIAEFFVRKFAEKYKKNIHNISPGAIEILNNYKWPGNVRELENAIEYSFIRAKRSDSVCLCCLPPHIRPQKECKEKLDARQLEIDDRANELLHLLRKNNWNKTRVAEILGVDRSTVHRRLKSINQSEF
ncbi:MAG: sigma 54-interacting transcriptional regulator [Melioribacteraceae bacterium]|nr:sigma 54-interacting transcriptional regulator [Melioribacteraceae bacterium]MCF8354066.1 sigma 54-interacting transcriptional regulator [Melioribacteraceae bacterium]MCF8393738.1 sigma 54-interacting transcriptional regulator [Melioribacteraceae bacterium]MCF8419482.1 sigma 54-interacting transcriptional regulator [Melioribacteraceae bacterium]